MNSTGRAGARFEALAESWEAAGSPTSEDLSPLQAALVYLWIHSDGAQREGVSPRLATYVNRLWAALDQKRPGWYEDQLDGHDCCKSCGERFRFENLSSCTDCGAVYGPYHRAEGGLASNGNYQCAGCGTGEIVG